MVYTQKSTDKVLVDGCKKGDRLAQKYLYQRYYGKMLGISMRYTGHRSEAEDVLNRAFLKVFQSIDKYIPKGQLGGWIARIVFNTSIDYVRSRVKYQEVMDFNIEKDKTIEAEAIEQLYAGDLYKIIQQLPENTRAVFSLYVVDGYKHREIAEMLKISTNTSKWHLANGKKILKERLKNYSLEFQKLAS